MPELQKIQGVEIFSAGVWNGDHYTAADLDEMVRAYEANKDTLRPYLKLGHDDKQALLQKDGYPAAGWIENVRRVGEKLVADFVDIPNKIYELIQNKAYRKVSSEIYWNVNINKNRFKRFLSGVALLGTDLPACTNLSDILAQYGISDFEKLSSYALEMNDVIIKTYNSEDKMSEAKSEAQIKAELDLQAAQEKLAELEGKVKEYKSQESEIAELKAYKEEAEKKIAEAEAQAFAQEVENQILELEKEDLVSPSMKPYIKALLLEEKKSYSIEDKQFSKSALIKEILKLHSNVASVNLTERSEAAEGGAKDSEGALDKEIKKHMDEHNVDYVKAYKAVLSGVEDYKTDVAAGGDVDE